MITENKVAAPADGVQHQDYATARRERLDARYFLWQMAGSGHRVRGCGKRIRSGEGVVIKASGVGTERRAGVGGVMTCGSVWACPVCAAKILTHRQGEVETILSRWHERGGRVGLLTLTMRHNKGQSLDELWSALSYGWSKVTSGRAWVAEQQQHGVMAERTVRTGRRAGQVVTEPRIHFVRVVEVTQGDHGWHVHLHVLLLLAPKTSRADVELLGDQMFTRWRDALVRKGLAAPTWEHGVDARRLDGDAAAATLADYFTKVNYRASSEVSRSDKKLARKSNRTPWGLLRDAMTGDADAYDLWREYELASTRRRQMTLSHGLREFLLADVDELTDEEIAEQDEGGEVVATVPKLAWHWIVRNHLIADLLHAAEEDDWGGALSGWLSYAEQQGQDDDAARRAYWGR